MEIILLIIAGIISYKIIAFLWQVLLLIIGVHMDQQELKEYQERIKKLNEEQSTINDSILRSKSLSDAG